MKKAFLYPLRVALIAWSVFFPLLCDASTSRGRLFRLVSDPGTVIKLRYRSDVSTPKIVSAAEVSRPFIVIVDYSHLYCLNTRTNAVSVIPAPPAKQTGVWVPTGVAYSRKNGALYIANYLGNNIIEGSIDCLRRRFDVKTVITSPDLISPENVALNDAGDFLASANYDGSSVTAFRRSGGIWKPAWKTNVGQAHAVAVYDGYVYATSLRDRKILKLTEGGGSMVAEGGKLGADGLDTGLMWPTGMAILNGSLFLSDAHTGYVCEIDKATLSSTYCFGGNGLGSSKFNMPYGVAALDKDLLVLSTFQSRMVEISIDQREGIASIVKDRYWIGDRNLNADFFDRHMKPGLRVVAFANDPYSSICTLPDWLAGYACGYSGLTRFGKFLAFPMNGSIYSGSEYYFTEAFIGKAQDGVYFSSPQQNPGALNLRIVNGVPYMLRINFDIAGFQDAERIVSPTKTVPKSTMTAAFNGLYATVSASRNKFGVVPFNRAAELFAGNPDVQASRKALSDYLSSSSHKDGPAFLREYVACSAGKCNLTALHDFAKNIMVEVLAQQNAPLDRAIIPCMLSNAACEPALRKAMGTAGMSK